MSPPELSRIDLVFDVYLQTDLPCFPRQVVKLLLYFAPRMSQEAYVISVVEFFDPIVQNPLKPSSFNIEGLFWNSIKCDNQEERRDITANTVMRRHIVGDENVSKKLKNQLKPP